MVRGASGGGVSVTEAGIVLTCLGGTFVGVVLVAIIVDIAHRGDGKGGAT